MRCPRCRDEYEPGVTRCAGCDVALVPDGTPLPPRVDAVLGTFHPIVADRVLALLSARRIAHDEVRHDDDRVEVVVDREWRDDVRTELVVSWNDLVGRLPADTMYEVVALGGPQPGWFDAPRGAWVDRQGRLQMDPTEDEAADQDARRLVGPTLLTLGAVVLLFGWYGGGGSRELAVLAGLGLVLTGLFLPR